MQRALALDDALKAVRGGDMPGTFEPAMKKELKHRSFIFRNNPPRVERAVLGGDAGLYGAARLPFVKDE